MVLIMQIEMLLSDHTCFAMLLILF